MKNDLNMIAAIDAQNNKNKSTSKLCEKKTSKKQQKKKLGKEAIIAIAISGTIVVFSLFLIIFFAFSEKFDEQEQSNDDLGRCDGGFVEKHGACVQYDLKPLIYLYPESETEINVKLGSPELLTTTYPKYNEETGWNVIASPDGNLKANGKIYYGLYWEGVNTESRQRDEGFVVAGEDIEKFLEEKLEILGLNERESNEFIVYWLPKLEHNEWNYIRFATAEEIEEMMPLEITPEPETIIRVLMEFKPLEERIDIKEQGLTRVERRGYTAVEWGGTNLNENRIK